MDEKGFISIEYLFSIFIMLIIALGLLFYASSTIMSEKNIEDNMNHRLVLDNVANVISQVNSNGNGYSKTIILPSNIGYYEITVEKNKIIMKYGDNEGETQIPMLNPELKYKLYNGKSYTVTKNSDGKIMIT